MFEQELGDRNTMWTAFSTATIDPRDRFAYWSEVVCDTFVGLDCVAAGAKSFKGRLKSARLAGLKMSVAKTDAHEAIRSYGK